MPTHHRGWLQKPRESRHKRKFLFATAFERKGEVTDDFLETKLTKMWKFMREFGALAFRGLCKC